MNFWVEQVLPSLKQQDRPLCLVQEAGTILHIPEGWHHATLNIGAASSLPIAATKSADSTELTIAVGIQRKLASSSSLLLYLNAAQQLTELYHDDGKNDK